MDNGVIGECPYFRAEKLTVVGDAPRTVRVGSDSFVCFTVVAGVGTVGGLAARKGDSFLCPASAGEVGMRGNMTVIAVSVPKQ